MVAGSDFTREIIIAQIWDVQLRERGLNSWAELGAYCGFEMFVCYHRMQFI